MQPPKKRYARIERDDEVSVHEDENAHLWAVSYSDFLMALLSFFILFFSMDTPKKEKLILNLAEEFKTGSGPGGFAGEPIRNLPNEEPESQSSQESRLPAAVLKSISKLNVVVDKERENLIVNFPNDIYQPGQHVFSADKDQVLRHFLSLLKPHEKLVKIYFEGHADSAPLRYHRNNVVTDNFVLSSLRASSALTMARQMGFSEKTMFIQAASSNTRNSRSLSVRIEPLQEEQ